jgi:hypothetical protein
MRPGHGSAENGGTEVSGKLWMEPRGPMRALMLLMRLVMKRIVSWQHVE